MREVFFLDKHSFLSLCPETFADLFFFFSQSLLKVSSTCSGFDTGKDMQSLVRTSNTLVVMLEEKWWLL